MSVTVLNTDAGLSGKTLVNAEDAQNVTGLKTFNRSPNAPFAVQAASAVVTNLNADKLDGQDAPTGTIVGTSDSQTLTNMTLTSPIVNWTVVTVTDTGTQNNYAPGLVGDTIIRCNNASLLTITGLAGGFSGQRVRFVAINGQVDFAYSSASSSVGNKFINWVSSGNTSIVTGAGSGYVEFVYDATSTVWRMVAHEQGAWITWTPTWTCNGVMTFTGVTNTSTRYYLRGRCLSINISSSGTLGGTTNTTVLATLPLTFTSGSQEIALGRIIDGAGVQTAGISYFSAGAATQLSFSKIDVSVIALGAAAAMQFNGTVEIT